MSARIIEFKSTTQPIAHFIRVDNAHRRFGDLYAAGRLPIRRAVFDASRIAGQKEFVEALRRDGVEIVLDTEVAELAAPEKFKTHVKDAPWASAAEGDLLDPHFFDGTHSQVNIINWIAKFAVEQKVHTVLAPSHYLADKNFSNWLSVDTQSCIELRKSLDREGGNNIAIDYPIIHLHTALNQQSVRNQIVERINDLPIDNIWIRASGLGTEPKPQATKQFLRTLYDFHNFNKPIIIDHVDGLMAQSLVAFGGASGLAQGIGERCQFKANSWHKTPQERDSSKPFGRTTYIPISGLGRRLSAKELKLLASAKGGKKYLGCQDICCKHGVQNMLEDSRQHSAYQAISPIKRLSEVPDLNRENFFLESPLLEAERLARNIKDLNPSPAEAEKYSIDISSLKGRLTKYHHSVGKLSDALSLLHSERGAGAPRAKVCSYRTGCINIAQNRNR
ncbi:hypothetical protein [Kiloniella majae]|uniref:hypothetical protein n=1 Tax=Kiloniella majae TaxID=1938558 RepID=UPI000A278A24|nr:hypothetical protein [Kiloniella majae]